MLPKYQANDEIYFVYDLPESQVNPTTGELAKKSVEYPAVIISVAGTWPYEMSHIPQLFIKGAWQFYYAIALDWAEIEQTNLPCPIYPDGGKRTTDVITERQISGERIAF
jgi:hypothetical protein